jgi:hypothetical protein
VTIVALAASTRSIDLPRGETAELLDPIPPAARERLAAAGLLSGASSPNDSTLEAWQKAMWLQAEIILATTSSWSRPEALDVDGILAAPSDIVWALVDAAVAALDLAPEAAAGSAHGSAVRRTVLAAAGTFRRRRRRR